MNRWVEIEFDCLPLRTIGRLDVPIDASPKYRARCEAIGQALAKHGSHNTYYLYNALCRFHLTNHPDIGMLEFNFQGTLITDETDAKSHRADLEVTISRETCDWITQPIVEWFQQSVSPAVLVEFDRYIAAGDLQKTRERIAALQQQADAQGGFVGMYL